MKETIKEKEKKGKEKRDRLAFPTVNPLFWGFYFKSSIMKPPIQFECPSFARPPSISDILFWLGGFKIQAQLYVTTTTHQLAVWRVVRRP